VGDVLEFILRIVLFLVGGIAGFVALLIMGLMMGDAGGFSALFGFCIAFGGIIALTVFVVHKRDDLPRLTVAFLTGFVLSACFALLIAGICSLGGPMHLE